MKGIDFLSHLGSIKEQYIIEAESSKKIRTFSYEKWIGLAASILLICILSFSGYRHFIQEQSDPNIALIHTEELGRGIPIDDQSSNELSFFEKIIELIASFFE